MEGIDMNEVIHIYSDAASSVQADLPSQDCH